MIQTRVSFIGAAVQSRIVGELRLHAMLCPKERMGECGAPDLIVCPLGCAAFELKIASSNNVAEEYRSRWMQPTK